MNSRTTKILVVICVILIIVSAVLSFFDKKKTDPAAENQNTNQVDLTATPIPTVSTRDNTYTIPLSSSMNEIEAAFKRFVSEKPEGELKGAAFIDEAGNALPLSSLQTQLNFNLPTEIAKIIENREYDIYYCAKGTIKNIGLILYSAPGGAAAAPAKLQAWEPTMLKDLHALLFPNIGFSQEQLSQPLQFKDGQARFAEIIMPGGAKGSLNYKQMGDPIIFSSSLECLQKAQDYYFDVDSEQ